MKIGYASDVGKRRELDEDSIVVVRNDAVYESGRDQAALLVVADGMGGHNAGEVASRQATAKMAEEIVGMIICVDQRYLFNEGNPSPLSHAIKEANRHVFNKVKENPQYSGMGTTITAAVILGHLVHVGHVGDSRAYIINEDIIRQVTKDHSLVQEMVDRGEITKKEARVHPRKNIITRAVGIYQDIDVDIFWEYIYGDEYLLICCDGLTDMVDDEDIHKIIKKYQDPQKICDELVKKANRNGGFDNISAIVAQFDELPKRTEKRSDKTEIKTEVMEKDEEQTRFLREGE